MSSLLIENILINVVVGGRVVNRNKSNSLIRKMQYAIICLIIGIMPLMSANGVDANNSDIQSEDDKCLFSVSVKQGPELDGLDDDACWKKAIPVEGFAQLSNLMPSRFDIEVKCVYDSKNIYMFFRCKEDKINLKADGVNREDPVWFDSCIELFLYPNYRTFAIVEQPLKEQFYHHIFNYKGVQFDEVGTAGETSWDGDWKVETRVSDHEWTAEVQIPFLTDAAYRPKRPRNMEFWRIQIARNAYDSQSHEYSSLFPTKGLFRTYSNFGKLIFITKRPSCLQRSLDTVGPVKNIRNAIKNNFKALKGSLANSELNDEFKAMNIAYKDVLSNLNSISDKEYMLTRETLIDALKTISVSSHELLQKNLKQTAINRADSFVVVKHPPVEDSDIVTPDYTPDYKLIGKDIEVKLCRNEYEPASFVLWSWFDLTNINVTVSSFKGATGTLPSDTADIRWVKCWYQGSTFANTHTGYELTPELLLKNPELVQVDYENQINLHPYGNRKPREYPADSETLLPIAQLPPQFSQQVWLNIKVAENTPAGKYSGEITVSADGVKPVTLGLDIEVLDFTLLPSPIKHGFYSKTAWGRLSEERVMKEIDNLVEHGATHVSLWEAKDELPQAVEYLSKSKLKMDPLYVFFYGTTFDMRTGYSQERAYTSATNVLAELKPFNIKDVYLYLPDEARGERLKKSVPIADGIHQAGAKTWVAGYGNYFPIAGHCIDTIVMAGAPVNKGLVDTIHEAGSKIFCYANPQGGVERPEVYRRNYGLLLWASGYDGGMTFAWSLQFGGALKDENGKRYYDMWDDFDSTHWRDHCMAYLTESGVVDTIQWEGWREGVDDCRYLSTLLESIADARKSGCLELANRAEKWIDFIRQNKTKEFSDLDSVREQMIIYIQECIEQTAAAETQQK